MSERLTHDELAEKLKIAWQDSKEDGPIANAWHESSNTALPGHKLRTAASAMGYRAQWHQEEDYQTEQLATILAWENGVTQLAGLGMVKKWYRTLTDKKDVPRAAAQHIIAKKVYGDNDQLPLPLAEQMAQGDTGRYKPLMEGLQLMLAETEHRYNQETDIIERRADLQAVVDAMTPAQKNCLTAGKYHALRKMLQRLGIGGSPVEVRDYILATCDL